MVAVLLVPCRQLHDGKVGEDVGLRLAVSPSVSFLAPHDVSVDESDFHKFV